MDKEDLKLIGISEIDVDSLWKVIQHLPLVPSGTAAVAADQNVVYMYNNNNRNSYHTNNNNNDVDENNKFDSSTEIFDHKNEASKKHMNNNNNNHKKYEDAAMAVADVAAMHPPQSSRCHTVESWLASIELSEYADVFQ